MSRRGFTVLEVLVVAAFVAAAVVSARLVTARIVEDAPAPVDACVAGQLLGDSPPGCE